MTDFLPHLRSAITDDPDCSEYLSVFKNEPAVFTRRPVDKDAKYPFVIINPPGPESRSDYLSCLAEREVSHNIIVYGQNDTADNYRKIDITAQRIQSLFDNLDRFGMTAPDDVALVKINANGPFPAPTDDNESIARAIPITIKYNRSL